MVERKDITSLITTLLVLVAAIEIQPCLSDISRSDFPKGFVFGAGSAAYQVEGAVKADGRGQSIWDTFAHQFGKITDFSNADVSVDQYHRYEEDIQILKDMGLEAYRFSISWARIYPNGTGAINQAGIDHYNKVIDSLIAKGIQPYVTLYHWDLPQALDDRYGGWLNPQVAKDFAVFAETCFQNFGDRVKRWITINEPHMFVLQGYSYGLQAPGRCSIRPFCKAGDASTEPYIAAHNVLLAHASAVDVYRKKFKAKQQGTMGITLDVIWFYPASNKTEDIEATERAQDFQLGWFLDPIVNGDYPSSMRTRVGNRLPKFSAAEAALVKGSMDFLGINHYTSYYAFQNLTATDSGAVTSPLIAGKLIGEMAYSIWLYIVPEGIRSLMNHIRTKYGNPPVVITENGMDYGNAPPSVSVKDEKRIRYYNDYLTKLSIAIKEGCNVKGHFAWSLTDSWEWGAGYASKFGLVFVDFKDNLKRYPKDSVTWYKNFMAKA